MKKLIAWLVMVPMVCSLGAFTKAAKKPATDPFGKYDQTVTLNFGKGVDATEKFAKGDTPENNPATRYVKQMLNIQVKDMWEAATGNDYDQKVNLSIASNNLPDAMVVNATQFRQMANAGELEDMTKVYNEYASPAIKAMINSSKGQALKAATIGGKLLAIPSCTISEDGMNLMWIRKDWLDKLGMKVPKTIKELEAVAKAFVEKDPGNNGKGNTIGIAGPQNGAVLYADFITPSNITFSFDPIFSAFNAYPGYWVKDSKGKAAYGSILPETKKALTELRSMYASGLIDKQMGLRKDATEPAVNGKAGIFFGPWWLGYWPLPDAWKINSKANWQAYAVPLDAKGRWSPHMPTASTQFLVVRKGYEHPEAAMKILNLNVRDESKYGANATSDEACRVTIAPADEATLTLKAVNNVLSGKKKPEDYATNDYFAYHLLKSDTEKAAKVKLKPYNDTDIQYWNQTVEPQTFERLYSVLVGVNAAHDPKVKFNPVYSLLYSQTTSMSIMWTNLRKLEDQTFLKIIMGEAPVSSFDQFVKEWKAQGGDKITAEVETEYKK